MNWNDRRTSDSSYQVRAISILRKDYGKVFIRRKSLIDKLINAFAKISVTFDNDKAFTSKFYVVAEGNGHITDLMDQDFRDVIMEFELKDLSINIINRTLMVEYRNGFDAQKTAKLTEFACAMCIF